MPRRLANFAIGASLALAVLVAVVWVRGLFVRDQLTTELFGRKVIAAVYPQHVYLTAYPPLASGRVATDLQTGLRQYPSRPIYWEVRYHRRPGGAVRLGVPFWLPLALAATPPLWWLIQRIEWRRRRTRGLCPDCGYDLRATPDRCPECGRPVEPNRAAPEDVEPPPAPNPRPATERYAAGSRWQISMKP